MGGGVPRLAPLCSQLAPDRDVVFFLQAAAARLWHCRRNSLAFLVTCKGFEFFGGKVWLMLMMLTSKGSPEAPEAVPCDVAVG